VKEWPPVCPYTPTEDQPNPIIESTEEFVIDTVVRKLLALINKGPQGNLSADQLTLKSHLLIARNQYNKTFTS
jgi:hypothetical protein